MKRWKKFENDVLQYLQEVLQDYDLLIRKYGGEDSTKPDIEIILNSNKEKINIETKMPLSQTSQFVVDIKDNKFKYSSRNIFPENKYSKEIVSHLNDYYELYKNVSQKGIIVSIPESIAFNYIISNMKNKNISFIISVDKEGNKKVLPLNYLREVFNVKTVLRRKKSGSRSLGKKYYEDFKEKISTTFPKYKNNMVINNDRLFLNIPEELKNNKRYISSDKLKKGEKYFLSYKGEGKYEARITSSTNNANIIFQLSFKDNVSVDSLDNDFLLEYIKNNI